MSDKTLSVGKSAKVEGGAPAQLFDFIYRDARRIESLYAQFFSGLLSAVQTKRASTEEQTKQAKVNAAVAEGSLLHKGATNEERTESIVPHDAVLLDLLDALKAGGWITRDYASAKPGELVLIKGTIFFADRYLLSIAEMGLEMAMREAKGRGQAGKAEARIYEMIGRVLPKMTLAPSFFLRTETDEIATGTIKESGLDEPISAYYFKHGAGGMGGMYVLAYKEHIGNSQTDWAGGQFISGMTQAVEAIRSMFFPQNDLRLSPVTIFRKLEPATSP